jgi:tRNA dimethylallyltransferase
MSSLPQIIVVTGPTASGKTALAVKLAKHLHTEIVSADSRQFYRELSIGSAAPTAEELLAAPHHFVGCRSIREEYSAGQFGRDAQKKINELLEIHPTVIVCGGSGLYLHNLLFAMDAFPEVTRESEIKVASIFNSEGLEGWQRCLKELDPIYYEKADIRNPARLRRALEVVFSSGRPFSSFHTGQSTSLYSFTAIGTDISKEELHFNINRRVDEMIFSGLEEEARKVHLLKDLKTLKTVGYQEFFAYFEGFISREDCIGEIKRHTRQYAKRQMTWFNKYLPFQKVNVVLHAEEILKTIRGN